MRPRLGIEVAASSDRAWHELIDLGSWPHWGPTVRSAFLDDGSGRLSAGASGSVQTALGLWLPFRVECWRDDGPLMSWSWRVAGVPATEHSVISRGPSRCRVDVSVPWWAVPYLGVVRVGLTRIRSRAEGVASN